MIGGKPNHAHWFIGYVGKYMKDTMPGGYKTFFMLNSDEHKIYLAHKCFNIYQQDKYNT